MTSNQFGILMNEIKSLREQMTRVEDRLREVEVVQATEEMARKVRMDLDTEGQIGLRWKVGVLVSIAGTVVTVVLKLIEGLQ
jgi:hypothetical protein